MNMTRIAKLECEISDLHKQIDTCRDDISKKERLIKIALIKQIIETKFWERGTWYLITAMPTSKHFTLASTDHPDIGKLIDNAFVTYQLFDGVTLHGNESNVRLSILWSIARPFLIKSKIRIDETTIEKYSTIAGRINSARNTIKQEENLIKNLQLLDQYVGVRK